jgi:hypothetical protein
MEISMYGRTDPSVLENQKKLTNKTNTHTENLGGNTSEVKFPSRFISIRFTPTITGAHELIKRDRWHNLMEISMYGRTDFVRPYRTKKLTDKRQTHTQKTIVHLKELKLNVTDGTI